MATDVETVIDPDNASGTDYISMDGWEDDWGSIADSGDCVTYDQRAVGVLRCTGGTTDSAAGVIVDGWTSSDVTRYPMVIARTSEGYRHNGQWTVGNFYRLAAAGGQSQIRVKLDYFRAYGVAVQSLGNNYIGAIGVEGDGVVIESCLVYCNNRTHNYGLWVHNFTGSDVGVRLGNNIVYGFDQTGNIGIHVTTVASCNLFVHNNTVARCTTGISIGSATGAASSNLTYNTTTAYSGLWGGSNNGYDNGSDPNTGGTDISGVAGADIFSDPDNDDYRLWAYQDNPVFNKGANLTADADYPITDDWEGDARTSFDLGFDEIGDLFAPPDTRREDLNERICRWALRTPIGGKLPQSGYRRTP